MSEETLTLVQRAAQLIYEKKGNNVLGLDVRGISSVTDFLVIAEGNVDRHNRAISQTLVEELKKEGHFPIAVDGMEKGEWVVMDYGDFIIHLFLPELRNRYQLENLWNDGVLLDLHL